MTAEPGSIPPSNLLSEALPDSLQELFSLDPESYQRQHRDEIVRRMREMRDRLDNVADGSPVRHQRVKKEETKVVSNIDPAELGL